MHSLIQPPRHAILRSNQDTLVVRIECTCIDRMWFVSMMILYQYKCSITKVKSDVLLLIADHLSLLPHQSSWICRLSGIIFSYLLYTCRCAHYCGAFSTQKLDNGKLAESDDFFDYVELVENPVKAILITSKCVNNYTIAKVCACWLAWPREWFDVRKKCFLFTLAIRKYILASSCRRGRIICDKYVKASELWCTWRLTMEWKLNPPFKIIV